MPEIEPAPDAPPRAGAWRRVRRVLVLIFGPALVAVLGVHLYVAGGRFVETENAYVKADKVAVSAKISGQIARVLVEDNRPVEPGQVLFQLEEEPFRIALVRAQARLQNVRREIASLKASYRQKQEELELDRNNVSFFQREYERLEGFAGKGVISEKRIDEARHNLTTARQRVAVSRQELSRILAALGGEPDRDVESDARYLESQAERDRAALDLAYAVVVAPIAGIAGRTPKPGDYTTAGAPVMHIVSHENIWVEANFKETDLTHVRPGQAVRIRVDTYPDREWQATVDSISQATGAEFALLPPQNATGNWVKVVQRIPVRIDITRRAGDPPPRAGMSVSAAVDTGHKRSLADVMATAFSWIEVIVAVSRAEPGGR